MFSKFYLNFILMIICDLNVRTFQFNLLPKDFKVIRAQQCAHTENHPIRIKNLKFNQVQRSVFHVNGEINILENISGSIGLILKTSRCTVDNQQCDPISPITFSSVCESFTKVGAVWTPLVKSIEPPLSCPLTNGTHRIKNGSFDLTVFSRLPIDGYRYLAELVLVNSDNNVINFKNSGSLRHLLCLDTETLVTVARNVNNKIGKTVPKRRRN